MQEVIIIGAGGHAKVIADIIEKSGDKILGFLDDNKEKNCKIVKDYKVIGKIQESEEMQKENPNVKFVIAIGNNELRMQIENKYELQYYTAIHPNAVIAMDTCIGEGTVIMANACINTSAKIGKHCIINTGAIIEHDNKIEDFVHISPNVALAGTVEIGSCTHIGVGAIVKNNTTITEKCIIGAGAVVIKNIEIRGTYVGVPAKKIK